MRSYLGRAIQKLKPNSEYVIQSDDYSTIKWVVLEGEAPTQAEIDAAIEQVKAEELAAEAKAATDKAALLAKLGITADEAKLLLS
jgi:hypothetical protein